MFVARGRLWTAPLGGGRATELARAVGDVVAPRFSPDGRRIGFTRWNAGHRDLYVVDIKGGHPRRLTFDGRGDPGDDLMLGWTPDGNRIAFLSSHGAPHRFEYRAFTVAAEGGLPRDLGLDRAGLLAFAPDGRSIVLDREFRKFELRKRYLGGKHENLYSYDLASKALSRLTTWQGTDSDPMPYGRKLFFLSDRGAGYRQNIWVMDRDTAAVRQVTRFTEFDVDWPSIGAGGITFQQGGDLYRLDPATETIVKLAIDVPDDATLAPAKVAASADVRVEDALGGLDYALAPDGSGLLVSTHGDIVRVSAKGRPVDLTDTPGVDEDHPSWSPDGRWIAYTTDADGEQQVVVRPAGGGAARALTRSRLGYFYTAAWSPGSDRLIVADAGHALWLLSLNGSAPRLIARDPQAEIRDAGFSPEGRWLAYSTQRATRQHAIHLYNIASGHDVVISSPMESDRLPAFTEDGRYLAFVSQRHEQPFVSDRGDESLIATLNSDGIYAVPLARTTGALVAGRKPPAASAGGAVTIDFDGLMARATALPVVPAVITRLDARGDALFYEVRPPQVIDGDLAGFQSALHRIDLSSLIDRTLVSNVSTYSLSAHGSAVAYLQDGRWSVAAIERDVVAAVPLDLSAIRVPEDPKRDWAEMLDQAWRLDRDVFFNPTLNGTNWPAVRAAYRRLYPRIASQQDFLYVLGQMQGEIASSHTFIDVAQAEPPPPATPLLGADYALDAATDRYRFARLYPGDQSRPAMRGPLGAPGVAIDPGDYLLAVNGRELVAPMSPLALFVGLHGPVELTVAATANGPRRQVTIEPISDDRAVRRLAWERCCQSNANPSPHDAGGSLRVCLS